MFADRIEGKWIDAFCEVFERCAVKRGDTAAILSETQSRALNVHLAELALLRLGARPFHVVVPTPRNRHPVPVRSTGASEAIGKLAPVVAALGQAGFVVDCTIEGLMHAPETPAILKAGARIMVISNEHPEALERMAPDSALEKSVRAAAKLLRGAKRMTVKSRAGTSLDIDMAGASTVGIWGWTDKPGTLGALAGRHRRELLQGRLASTARWCSTAATSTSPSSATWKRRCASRSRPTTSRASRARAPTRR